MKYYVLMFIKDILIRYLSTSFLRIKDVAKYLKILYIH
jgi:hypothetical protein